MKKTYKREVACIQMALHWILVIFTCLVALYQPERNISDLVSMVTGLAIWVYGFAGAAFGLDSWAKQIKHE